MKREYTEEEILELGRKALAKHKITVYVVHYTHKHGDDISVYGSRESAERSVRDLISNRISASWDQFDIGRFEGCKTVDEALTIFHEVEHNVSYGETIEILERVVGA